MELCVGLSIKKSGSLPMPTPTRTCSYRTFSQLFSTHQCFHSCKCVSEFATTPIVAAVGIYRHNSTSQARRNFFDTSRRNTDVKKCQRKVAAAVRKYGQKGQKLLENISNLSKNQSLEREYPHRIFLL